MRTSAPFARPARDAQHAGNQHLLIRTPSAVPNAFRTPLSPASDTWAVIVLVGDLPFDGMRERAGQPLPTGRSRSFETQGHCFAADDHRSKSWIRYARIWGLAELQIERQFSCVRLEQLIASAL
jgi:hypothetical protein